MSQSTDCSTTNFGVSPTATILTDIEHMSVVNDPRMWSTTRKGVILFLISSAAMLTSLSGSMQSPAIAQMLEDLHATNTQFSLTVSLFILVQGLTPTLWTSFSEIKGRKTIYISSLALAVLGSIGPAVSKSMNLLLGFRLLQAIGASAAIPVGGATLADMFDPIERGRKIGIYYMSPLLGSAIGPILGGGLTVSFGWRAIFWFMVIFAGVLCISFLFFFHDTFRNERSLTYQMILKRRFSAGQDADGTSEKTASTSSVQPDIKLSLKDVNPLKPIYLVVRRWNNVAILFASTLIFSFNSFILYAAVRTLSFKYHFSALNIGAVMLAYGSGCVSGSLLGGRWSDYMFARLKTMDGNVVYPEKRLHAAVHAIFLTPPSSVGLGWAFERQAGISVVSVMLFLCGFSMHFAYASTLAYIADANLGQSSAAFASNSTCRGLGGFIATEIVVPLQDSLGDGFTFTLWGGLMLISGLSIVLVCWCGEGWRKAGESRGISVAAQIV